MARILVVDDEPALVYAMNSLVKSMGHEPVGAASGAQALTLLDGVDLVVTDFAMPQMDGLALLGEVRARDESLPVVLLTAHGSERIAVRAMKAGAYEYVTKPFEMDEMASVVERALETRALRVRNRYLSAERAIGKVLVGDSAPMRRLMEAAGRLAPRDITVLVRGETGTGKELVASLIHAQSRRAQGPLVRFNCAAVPAELADDEFFGHTKGAFTGAAEKRPGLFARARGGTLVLDEVGELPGAVQAKLLRALQDGEIRPVGADQPQTVDVRVIACTNRDLLEEVKAHRFRADLYYRLAVAELVVPPLRDHRDDIPALALEFARRAAERFGADDVHLSPALLQALTVADWPGNVRELENEVARLVALSPGGVLGPEGLTRAKAIEPPPVLTDGEVPADEPELSLKAHLEAVERGLITRMMGRTRGNQSEAARRLGLSRSALIDRLKKYGLLSPDPASPPAR